METYFKGNLLRDTEKKWKLMMQEISDRDSIEEEIFVPNINVSNKFEVLADQDTKNDQTSNTGVSNPPPPIVVREKIKWPKISETLKKSGITSVKNFNTRDGIRMILPTMDMYTKSPRTSR
ncbi:hypothetical protein JTB14_006704 [Gonioctena quinquepunctata]|nr:hypothetical protein JTB14_006704 [Gonioctena quinquepunctata]